MSHVVESAVDTLIAARWIIPVDPSRSVLENHALVIRGEHIVDILPVAEAKTRYQARQVLELNQHALTPGLINAHGHAAMSLFRGLADDLPLMTWLSDHIWPAEARWVDSEFTRDGVRLAIAEMLKTGTTCFSDMYFFPDIAGQVAAECHIRTQLCCPILDFPTNWAQDADEYIHKALQVHDRFRNHPLVNVAFGPHAPYTVSDGPLERIVTLAGQINTPIQMHVHETAHEVDETQTQGQRPLQRLHQLGLLSPAFQAVHMTQVDEEDLALLRETGAHVIHCPESNLKLASGFCPVERLQQAGVNVALGTDGAASNNDLDLWGEMRTAALLAKAVAQDAAALRAHEALAMATINGARALGIDDHTGSLETGKCADIVAVRLDDLCSQPVFDPVSHLVYTQVSDKIEHVWVSGRQAVREGQLIHLDTASIGRKARDWAEKIQLSDRS